MLFNRRGGGWEDEACSPFLQGWSNGRDVITLPNSLGRDASTDNRAIFRNLSRFPPNTYPAKVASILWLFVDPGVPQPSLGRNCIRQNEGADL